MAVSERCEVGLCAWSRCHISAVACSVGVKGDSLLGKGVLTLKVPKCLLGCFWRSSFGSRNAVFVVGTTEKVVPRGA